MTKEELVGLLHMRQSWDTMECADCGTILGRYAALPALAFVSCGACRIVYRVSEDILGKGIECVGAPCAYCGRLNDDGGPCEAPCGEENIHRVILALPAVLTSEENQ